MHRRGATPFTLPPEFLAVASTCCSRPRAHLLNEGSDLRDGTVLEGDLRLERLLDQLVERIREPVVAGRDVDVPDRVDAVLTAVSLCDRNSVRFELALPAFDGAEHELHVLQWR